MAVKEAYGRVRQLGAQEKEEFHNWAKYILLSVCDNKEAVVEEIMAQAEKGDDDMAFEYTIIREFNKEREKLRREAIMEGRMEGKMEGKIEGRIEAALELLEDLGQIPEELEQKIREQKDLDILKN